MIRLRRRKRKTKRVTQPPSSCNQWVTRVCQPTSHPAWHRRNEIIAFRQFCNQTYRFLCWHAMIRCVDWIGIFILFLRVFWCSILECADTFYRHLWSRYAQRTCREQWVNGAHCAHSTKMTNVRQTIDLNTLINIASVAAMVHLHLHTRTHSQRAHVLQGGWGR